MVYSSRSGRSAQARLRRLLMEQSNGCRSFKGSHLALMVELLAGPLVGGAVADKASSGNWGNLVRPPPRARRTAISDRHCYRRPLPCSSILLTGHDVGSTLPAEKPMANH